MSVESQCSTCLGSGEMGTEVGPVACPDCGGEGRLPRASTLIEWRSRDIEKAYTNSQEPAANDVRWLAAELRRARAALTEIVSLSQELDDGPLPSRLRFVANEVLGLYDVARAQAEVGDRAEVTLNAS
ncbi:MAG TPA: hypothetical protein VHM70_16285 [Polyangiaceae bacterium]|nr:hypothetical protein [Polyangiaceae bacterium]